MSEYAALFKPFRLKHLTLRNRIFSTAHAPAYAENGVPGEWYQNYHLEKARGGIGLTMFGGSSSVARDSPLVFSQISLADDTVVPYLERFAARIHAEGAAIMCQMSHMGRRAEWDGGDWLPLIAPSATREAMHRSYSKAMEDFDFARVRNDYAAAALRLKAGGLDGCEICANAHHLFDAFLSPLLNRRDDDYGGSTEKRMRFPLEILQAVREAVGENFVFGLRITGDDLVKGGFNEAEALDVITSFAGSGYLDFLNISQGNGDFGSGLQSMIPDLSYDSAPFLYLASAVKAAVDIPVFHAGAVRDLASANRAVEGGHVDLVGMTRAHVADPHLVSKLQEGREDDIRQCVGANYCIDRVGLGKPMACIQNVSTGREAQLPHVVARTSQRRKVVIVGGGPGGLEAARVARLRGHDVTLFEKSETLGGQFALASAVSWRSNMSGILRWLVQQTEKLGADIRIGTQATADIIREEAPDVVVLATGGQPVRPDMPGAEHAHSSHDILSGAVEPGANVLIFDIMGQHQALTVADFIGERGGLVEIVTPDQMVGAEIGETARTSYMKRLFARDLIATSSHHLQEIYAEGNALIAVLREHYSGKEVEREVTQVVCELGTIPNDDLYFALKPISRNGGEIDQDAFIHLVPQTITRNPDGTFDLYRIGDAVMSRNLHAALYDASRLLRAV
ncbi:hypothetical protein SAMN06297251_12153 [Fulvimarina manganoxydans]|uniref:2,4-dienoyl-CoA reductase n=1 Tax=Fulvimarina manganoxydans TaxID=937218 RepID=A0A1W2E532_9HYPH|nr:FAD-dependent oxidoreductase [Fulvimarina manganoxydans]SMD04931.1 hypothetical protein SAMN06297251_12153 [Fulvimarina manganoxydans]